MGKLANLARMTTATTGTGTITLGSAKAGFLTFAQAGINDGDVVSYGIMEGNNAEVGTGTYTASGTTLTRSVVASTNSNAAISLTGSAEVFVTPLASDFPAASRELLTAARTYYVRTDGSNSNSGLVNSSGGAFLTIQKALDTAGMLDTNLQEVTIQVVTATTWSENLVFRAVIGGGRVTLLGDTTTPSNITLNSTTGRPITIGSGAIGSIRLRGFRTTTSGGGSAHILVSGAGASVEIGEWNYGASAGFQLQVAANASVFSTTNYTISGGGAGHSICQGGGILSINSPTITLTGTPAFSSYFAGAENTGLAFYGAPTFSGSATGKRYDVTYNAVVGSYGVTLPGNAAGTTSTGGQYF